jgi:hypothetical protein
MRDSQTQTWSRVLMDGPGTAMRKEFADATQAAELEQMAQRTIGENLSQTPRAIAQRYQQAYEQLGWKQHGPMPRAVSTALYSPHVQASDGHAYIRDAQGKWTTPGTLYGANTANKDIHAELDATQAVLQQQERAAQTPAAVSPRVDALERPVQNPATIPPHADAPKQSEQTPPSPTDAQTGALMNIFEYREQQLLRAQQKYDEGLNAFLKTNPEVAAQVESLARQTGESLRTASQHILFPNGKAEDANLLLGTPKEGVPLVLANRELNEKMALARRNTPHHPEAEADTAQRLG